MDQLTMDRPAEAPQEIDADVDLDIRISVLPNHLKGTIAGITIYTHCRPTYQCGTVTTGFACNC